MDGSVVLTEANAERIVATLCRVRGAALKNWSNVEYSRSILDQFPSLKNIWKSETISWLHAYLANGKSSIEEFGTDWNDKFSKFDWQPFAAASIGKYTEQF